MHICNHTPHLVVVTVRYTHKSDTSQPHTRAPPHTYTPLQRAALAGVAGSVREQFADSRGVGGAH